MKRVIKISEETEGTLENTWWAREILNNNMYRNFAAAIDVKSVTL